MIMSSLVLVVGFGSVCEGTFPDTEAETQYPGLQNLALEAIFNDFQGVLVVFARFSVHFRWFSVDFRWFSLNFGWFPGFEWGEACKNSFLMCAGLGWKRDEGRKWAHGSRWWACLRGNEWTLRD